MNHIHHEALYFKKYLQMFWILEWLSMKQKLTKQNLWISFRTLLKVETTEFSPSGRQFTFYVSSNIQRLIDDAMLLESFFLQIIF